MKKTLSILLVLVIFMFSTSETVLAADTSPKYISGYSSFRRYVDTNFSQGSIGGTSSKTCVPVAICNVLSYLDYRGYSNLIPGSSVTQAEFNTICSYTNWNSSTGASTNDLLNGFKNYVKSRGYTGYVTLGLSWNQITQYIGYNTPLFAIEYSSSGNHVYTAVGYRVYNGQQQLYVYTGMNAFDPFWINFNAIGETYAAYVN